MPTARKTFAAIPLERVEPLVFDLAGETFHVPPKLPVSTLHLLAAVQLNAQGQRTYRPDVLLTGIRDALAEELWVADELQDIGAEVPTGRWVKVDDRQRFQALLDSPRVSIPLQTLGEIAMWIAEETTALPTVAPKD